MAETHCAICEDPNFIWKDCVDGARSTLARQLIEAVQSVALYHPNGDGTNRYLAGWAIKDDALTALRAKCKELGVDLPTINDTELREAFAGPLTEAEREDMEQALRPVESEGGR